MARSCSWARSVSRARRRGRAAAGAMLSLLLLLSGPALEASAQEGSWPSVQPVPGRAGWSYSVGNHRWVVRVEALPNTCAAVRVTVPWRRRDTNPLDKDSFFVSAASHLKVPHCRRESADIAGEAATYVFEAADGPGEYQLYFMPFETCEYSGGACTYAAQAEYVTNASRGCADEHWWGNDCDPLSVADVVLQSRSSFDAFTDEELPATANERAMLAASVPPGSPAVIVGEDRSRPLRMRRQPPYRWADGRPLAEFVGSAQPGERYTFQLGIWAHQHSVRLSGISFADLIAADNHIIAAMNLHCMNTNGTDYWGRPYRASPIVQSDHLLPLWIALHVPTEAVAGQYIGSALLHFDEGEVQVGLSITITGPPLADGGDGQAWRGTRLQWLDSTLAQDQETVPAPYTPLAVTEISQHSFAVSMLDKKLRIGPDGLPQTLAVGTAAAAHPEANAVEAQALSSPVGLSFSLAGAGQTLTPLSLQQGVASSLSVSWDATLGSADGKTTVNVSGKVDCTGYIDYRLDVASATPEWELALTVPAQGILAMGLGVPGDYLEDMAPVGTRSEWLVLDMGRSVTADAFGLCAAGNPAHTPRSMRLQASDARDGPWRPVTAFLGGPGTTELQTFAFGDQLQVTSRFWRWLIDAVQPSSSCQPAVACQAWVAEVQLRDASSGWIRNNGTAAQSIVIDSSGSSTPGMEAWQAVDGLLVFQDGRAGWDAGDRPLPGSVQSDNVAMASAEIVADWHWDGVNGNNAVWVGSSAAGLRLFLKGAEDLWQAAVPYDSKQSPPPPEEWDNNQKGGVRLFRNGTVLAYTGRSASSRRTLRFSILATPVRPLDLAKHYGERHVQLAGIANYTFLAEEGATIVDMHQGNPVNPWINYPYSTNPLMRNAANACHAVGMRFKVYNTMRELSNHCRELWAMLALNETFVLPPGPFLADVGRGADWLQEHVQYAYVPAWSNPVENAYPGSHRENHGQVADWFEHPLEQDAALKVQALSRWNNYYVEGLRQMIEDFDMDGLYLDEIAYDRVTMLRVRKVLGASRLVDHHADKGGFTPSPALNYLELFPFIDSLWYGEGFDYEGASPAYWLVEMSGLPHGVPADLLRYEGMTPQHFKGMLFASANRWQCGRDEPVGSCPFDPRDVWRLWDSFGIQHATMWGWWLDRERGPGTVPVTASDDQVKITSYVRRGVATLVAIGSWLSHDANITLSVDWARLGLHREVVECHMPRLLPMQPQAASFPAEGPIPVPAGQGLLLVLQQVSSPMGRQRAQQHGSAAAAENAAGSGEVARPSLEAHGRVVTQEAAGRQAARDQRASPHLPAAGDANAEVFFL